MAINIAYLELRLSGGSGNTDPNASLGGNVSSERVLSQSTTSLTNVTGVTIDYAAGNPLGAGTLNYTNTGQLLTWTANTGGAGVPVAVGVNGKYTIKSGSGGFLLVDVVAASLPGSDQADGVTIANIANETFDDVTKEESFAGDNEYRCFYFKNTHSTDPFLDIILFIGAQPSPGTIYVGADPAGPGDGVTKTIGASNLTRTGSTANVNFTTHGYPDGATVTIAGATQTEYNGTHTITYIDADNFTFPVAGSPASPATGTITMAWGVGIVVASESITPSGVTFDNPTSEITGISLGQINAGEVVAFWERRTIPTRNTISNPLTTSVVSAQAYF